jgi:hypothetical protein
MGESEVSHPVDAVVELLIARQAATESYHAARLAIGAAAVSEGGETGEQITIEDPFVIVVKLHTVIGLVNALAPNLGFPPIPEGKEGERVKGDDVVAILVSKPTAIGLLTALMETLGGTPALSTEKRGDVVRVTIKKYTAVELLNSLIVHLGMVPPGKKGKGKGSGMGKGKSAPSLGIGEGTDVSGKDATSRGPKEQADEVDCTAYAPDQAPPASNFLVQVFAHLPEQAATLEPIAKRAEHRAEMRVGSTLDRKIRRGGRLTFDLTMPGLEIDEPSQSIIWRGKPDKVQFGVTVPEDFKPRDLICKITVSESSIPIGHLKFMFTVVTAGVAAETRPVVASNLIRYRQAFISYASPDRAEVLKRVQMLNASRVNFFQDLLTLEPGDDWAKQIYEYIDQSDVFFLFWSKAASQSRWVEKEITYARERQASNDEAAPEIVPILIEGPPPEKPPEQLSFLHFNDRFLYFIAEESRIKAGETEN